LWAGEAVTLPLTLTDGAIPLTPFGEGIHHIEVRRRILKVEIPMQRADNWCWAAVAVGIACAYGDTELTQCMLATRVFSTENPPRQCCPSYTNGDCDVEIQLSRALTLPGHEHLEGPVLGPGPQSWDFIKNEIDSGRPIAVCVRGTSGHFLAITGYREDSDGAKEVERYVYYDDPLVSRGVRTLADFTVRSDGSQWFATYKTKGSQKVPFRIKVPPDDAPPGNAPPN
jgi:hypothetical protein